MQGKEFDILVVGAAGTVGKALVDRIAKQEWSDKNKIRKCHLVSRNNEKAKVAAERANSISESTEFIQSPADSIGGIDAKIAIICADINIKKSPDRDEITKGNIPMIAQLIPVLTARERAIGIVTNNSTTLPAIAAYYFSGNFDPNYLFGIAHVDTIRARGKVMEIYRQGRKQKIPADALDSFFVIGGHNEKEMIPAFCAAKVSGVYFNDIDLIRERYNEVEKEVEEFGRKQMESLKETNTDTVESIIKTINAVMDEKSAVCVSRYCDFNELYFKQDKDYVKLAGESLCLSPTYQVLPVRFKNLRTEHHEPDWFACLDSKTKKRFYAVAENHLQKIKNFMEISEKIEKPRRKSIRKLEIEEAVPVEKKESFKAKNVEGIEVLASAGRGIFVIGKDVKNSANFERAIKKIGRVEDSFYATFVNGFYLLDRNLNEKKKLIYHSDSYGSGFNRVIKHSGEYFASDSTHGIMATDSGMLVKIFSGSARAVSEYRNDIIFINKNRIIDLDERILFEGNSELVDILVKDDLLIVPEINGCLHFVSTKDKNIHLNSKIYCASLFDADGKDYVALGTEKGVSIIDLNGNEKFSLLENRKVKVIAGRNGNLLVAEPETYLKNLTGGFAYNLKEKIMSIFI